MALNEKKFNFFWRIENFYIILPSTTTGLKTPWLAGAADAAPRSAR